MLAALLTFLAVPRLAFANRPPLHQAATEGNLDEVMRLMANDPSLAYTRDEDGNTPLHHAAWNGHVPIAEYLLKAGVPADIRIIAPEKTLDGGTPLMDASVTGQMDMIALLLRNGADIRATDAEGNTALHHAVWNNRGEAVKALLDAGAEVNARRKGNVFALETAAYFGYEDIERLLIARGALINNKVYEGYTPLHQAAREGRFGSLLILTEAGADLSSRTDDGRTPLHVAAENGRENETRLLLAMSSDPNATTKEGLTPLGLAHRRRQTGTARILTEYLAAKSDTEARLELRNRLNAGVRTSGVVEQISYRKETFAETVGSEWTTSPTGAFFAPLHTTTIPGKTKRFLGEFGGQEVRLTLTKLPAHSQITVVMNLYIINSWDGNRSDDGNGPDLWEARVLDGAMLLRASFANTSLITGKTGKPANLIPIQSFPGEHPLEYYPGRTGAIANNVLNLPNRPMDAVYRLKFTFAHRGDNLVLVFSGKNLQALNDESWGIGSIEVRTGTVRVPNTTTARNKRK